MSFSCESRMDSMVEWPRRLCRNDDCSMAALPDCCICRGSPLARRHRSGVEVGCRRGVDTEGCRGCCCWKGCCGVAVLSTAAASTSCSISKTSSSSLSSDRCLLEEATSDSLEEALALALATMAMSLSEDLEPVRAWPPFPWFRRFRFFRFSFPFAPDSDAAAGIGTDEATLLLGSCRSR